MMQEPLRKLFVLFVVAGFLGCSGSGSDPLPDGQSGDVTGDSASDVADDAAADAPADTILPPGDVVDQVAPPDAGDDALPPDVPADVCVANCTDRECGDDGCGGSCGECGLFQECSPEGLCTAVACQSSKDCPGDLICDKPQGICVECVVDADCLDGWLCAPDQTCYEPLLCDSDKDCKDYDMVCDKEAGICVACLTSVDCPDQHYCLDFFCYPNACTPGSSQCDGKDVQDCAEDGSVWVTVNTCGEAEYCEEAQCLPQNCTPSEAYCHDNVAALCDEQGKGPVSEVDCTPDGLVCVAGECLDLVCAPGELFCPEPLVAGLCDAEGLAYEESACPEGTFCSGGECVPQLCVPGEPVCLDPGTASECDEYGTGPVPGGTDCTAQGQCCVQGVCAEPPMEICDNADNNCNGIVDDGCDDDGDQWCDQDMLVLGFPDICPNGPGDCEDEDGDIYPGQVEDQGDGLDNDCDGVVDEVEACPGTCTGHTMEAWLCALELCVQPPVISSAFQSPTGDNIDSAWQAVEHFGNANNDLIPFAGNSYGLLATGPATGTSHTTDLPGGGSAADPYASDGYSTYDNVEFVVTLKAPQNALGFSIDYIFMSVEYEEYIGSSFNDKFYIILKAPTTTAGAKEVINQTACSNPSSYYDLIDPVTGQKLCYIAINTAFSEPCSNPQTNIAGTGFECGGGGSSNGSSTGWLSTAWPVAPGEQFDLTFHIHDTSDGIYDSEVILDNFQWLYVPFTPGTTKK